MPIIGTVVNGAVLPDGEMHLPEGAKVRMELIAELDEENWPDFTDPNLPEDHPHAPYNREVELRLLRESIAEMNAGGGRPWREVMQELSLKHGLEPLQPE